MAETLRELVVALSLDSSNFSRNMRTNNQQINDVEVISVWGEMVSRKGIASTEARLSVPAKATLSQTD